MLDTTGEPRPAAAGDDPQPVEGVAFPASAASPDGTAPLDGTPAIAGAPPPMLSARPTVMDRVASLTEVIVCSGFPTQVLITLVLAALSVPAFSPDGRLSLRFVAWLSLLDTLIVVSLVGIFLVGRGERPSDVLLRRAGARREVALGLLLLPLAFVLILIAGLLVRAFAPWLQNPDGNPLAALLQNPKDIVLFALVAVLAGGLREEIQRGFVLHRFRQHLGGAWVGLLISSTAFGLGHAMQGWDAAILTGVLGAFWGAVFLWRRSVVAPVVCHSAFNLVEVLYYGLGA